MDGQMEGLLSLTDCLNSALLFYQLLLCEGALCWCLGEAAFAPLKDPCSL